MNFQSSVAAQALLPGIALPLHAGNLPTFNLVIKDGRYSPEQVEIPAGDLSASFIPRQPRAGS